MAGSVVLLHGATRHGTLVRIPGATHLVSLARPEKFTRVLVDAVEASRRAAPA